MTTVTDYQIPDVAFLGLCERAECKQLNPSLLLTCNIIGLKNVIISNIYPLSLAGSYFAISIYNPNSFNKGRIYIRSEDGEELIHIDIEVEVNAAPKSSVEQLESTVPYIEIPIWTTNYIYVDAALVKSPGRFTVFLAKDGQELTIGHLIFALAPAIPLTPDRIAAIKSDPMAAGALRYILTCNQCGDTLKSYTGLDKSKDQEENGFVWYEDLPNRFNCSCGKNDLDLTILRQNMHGLLGRHANSQGAISLTQLYEKDALETIVNDFIKLLDSNPLEEPIQKFIEDNPILLHQFSPQQIFYKPPILSKYKADFAVVNQKKELILIEIEKLGKPILKKDGGKTADLQRPFTQVEDWLFSIDRHRDAVLDGFNLNPSDVSKIRGIVIMGRDNECNEEHLRKLKWIDHGRTDFYTYDDLANALITLIRNMRDL